ncbi:MAG: hypothetical protein AB7V44_22790, partial [Pseudonocardia sp.]
MQRSDGPGGAVDPRDGDRPVLLGHDLERGLTLAVEQRGGQRIGLLVVERDLAGGDVDPEDVDVADPRVHPDQDGARLRGQRLDGEHPRPGPHRGEVEGGLARVVEVDAVQVPVLVAVGVLLVEQEAGIVGPVVGGDPAAGVVGDG